MTHSPVEDMTHPVQEVSSDVWDVACCHEDRNQTWWSDALCISTQKDIYSFSSTAWLIDRHLTDIRLSNQQSCFVWCPLFAIFYQRNIGFIYLSKCNLDESVIKTLKKPHLAHFELSPQRYLSVVCSAKWVLIVWPPPKHRIERNSCIRPL